MKNINVLPTDKSSRLVKGETTGRLLLHNTYGTSTDRNKTQYIYITSDEEIKEGDWFLDIISNTVHKAELATGVFNTRKKIILTTDTDLIKNGVQSIDDDFLEWFCKNPSCEEVKILRCPIEGTYTLDTPKEEPKKNFYCGDEVDYDDKCLEQCDRCVNATGVDYGYLPEESQKQTIIDIMRGDEEFGIYDETFDEYLQRLKDRRTEDGYKYTDEDFEKYKDYIKNCYQTNLSVYKCLEFMWFETEEIQPQQIWNEEKTEGIKQLIQDHKKETLEEAAERLLSKEGVKLHPSGLETYLKGNVINAMVEMAKWQQERSYSKEDLKRAWENGRNGTEAIGTPPFVITKFQYNSFSKWFEQFKKK